MNKCFTCGAEFDDSASFCAFCGTKLASDSPAPIENTADIIPTPAEEPTEEIHLIEEGAFEPTDTAPITEELDKISAEASEKVDPKPFFNDFTDDFINETPSQIPPTFGVYYPQKPKSGWWKIALAIVAGFLAIISTVVTFLTVFIPMFNEAMYSKGEISDGAYVNEFADLYFELDTRWKNAPKGDYAKCEKANGENCECGLYATRDNTELVVMFISGAGKSDGKEILENSAKQYADEKALEKALLNEILNEQGALDGSTTISVDIVSVGKVTETEIAGADYNSLSVEYEIIVNGKVYTTHRTLCARVIGDYAVIIQATSDTARAVDSALKSFKTIPLEYYYSYEAPLPNDVTGGY